MGEAEARGPYAKTPARRAAIVRAARDSFAEKGYAKASLRDIAERAGITHAGLLHHFRNKEELLAEVLASGTPGSGSRAWHRSTASTSSRPTSANSFATTRRPPS